MGEIIGQLGLDSTIFVQLGIFLVMFNLVSHLFFKPLQTLFAKRHQRTVADAEAAEKMLSQAEEKLQEYNEALRKAKGEAHQEYERIIGEAKKEEAKILGEARAQVKEITQKALAEMNQERERVQKELSSQVETMATAVTQKLMG